MSGEGERAALPEELMKRVMVLSCESTAEGGSCDVYLVGTAHVSQESCREVQPVISSLKPQVVFLELCSNRADMLTPQILKVPTVTEMVVDMWMTNDNLFGVLYSWFLAKVASKLRVLPGSEFRVAFEEALKCGGRVILGDRPVNITLKRAWGSMLLRHKVILLCSFFFRAVFLPCPEDLNKMVHVIDVTERVASEQNLVVAVVGKGHLPGIKNYWKQPIEVKDLLEVPSQKTTISAARVIKSIVIAVAGAVVFGIRLARKK